jgi:hypothetical protein
LDGQQRLTSIWVTFKGATIQDENYAHICLDLNAAVQYEKRDSEARREIKVFKETEPDNKNFVSLRDILSDDSQTNDNIRDKLSNEKNRPSRRRGIVLEIIPSQ